MFADTLSKPQQEITRGSVCLANLNPVFGSEQGGFRPVLVLQNNTGNKFSQTVIVAAITSRKKAARMPTHVSIPPEYGLKKESVILLEQIRTIDKRRLAKKLAELDGEFMGYVDQVLKLSLGMSGESREAARWSL